MNADELCEFILDDFDNDQTAEPVQLVHGYRAQVAALTAERDAVLARAEAAEAIAVKWIRRAETAEAQVAALTAERDEAVALLREPLGDPGSHQRQRWVERRDAFLATTAPEETP